VTLMGASMGIVPVVVFVSLLIGTALSVSMNRKLAHPSLWGGILGYIVFISVSFQPNSGVDTNVVYGLSGIGIAIMFHSVYFHKRHREYFRSDDHTVDSESTFRQDQLG